MSDEASIRARCKTAALAVLLVAGVVAAYSPALTAGFIWDDDDYVTENPLLYEPDGLQRIWFSLDAPSQYFPLVYTAFRIEYGIWGLEPFGYHLINVLLHALNALLLWILLRQIAVEGAWFAAAVFALHPVHVESVAWVTERKNVMSLLFSLASLIAWMRFIEPRRDRARCAYGTSLFFYALALASKVTACTLPAAQILLLWLRGHRIDRNRWAQVAPFAVLGVGMGLVITYWERYHIGTVGDRFSMSLVESFLVATRAVWFYLGKLLWPTNLAFSYPKFEIDPSDPAQYVWALAGVVLLGLFWGWRHTIGRAPLAAAIFFVATLSPLLGFIPLFTFWYTYVADHYQYMASIGPTALVAAGSVWWSRTRTRLGAAGRTAAATAVLLVLGVLTWNQSRVYENEETLWLDTLAKNPTSWMAQTNLGRAMMREGRYEEAVEAYGRVFSIRPDAHRAHVGVAGALLKLGRDAEAERHFEAAIALNPEIYRAHQALGRLKLKRRDREAAIGHYEAMIEIAPRNPTGHYLMGRALESSRRRREALAFYREALELDPDHQGARRAVARMTGFRSRSRGAE